MTNLIGTVRSHDEIMTEHVWNCLRGKRTHITLWEARSSLQVVELYSSVLREEYYYLSIEADILLDPEKWVIRRELRDSIGYDIGFYILRDITNRYKNVGSHRLHFKIDLGAEREFLRLFPESKLEHSN